MSEITNVETVQEENFAELLEHALQHDIQRILVNTNGLRLESDPLVYDALIRHKDRVEVYLQFDGINTETGAPVVLELWKVRHNPIASLALINEAYGNLPMTSAVLFDQTKMADAQLGGFGRMLMKAA